MKKRNRIIRGDALRVLKTLPDESIDMIMTSPPYWALRDYGVDGQLGLEQTFQEYINKLCDIFDEVKRVLKKEGTCWVNMGDTYTSTVQGTYNSPDNISGDRKKGKDTRANFRPFTGLPSKCLCQIPSRFSIEMTNCGWILRNEIIWHKPNCMPSSVKDRFTVDFEKLFFFTKSKKYYFEKQFEPLSPSTDIAYRKALRREKHYNTKEPYLQNTPYAKAIRKKRGVGGTYIPPTGKDHNLMNNPNGRNKRCVWKITTKPFSEAHFAVYPPELCETPIKAGCPKGGIVLDPFFGSGTTGLVAKQLGRDYLGIELNPKYIKIAEQRLRQDLLL